MHPLPMENEKMELPRRWSGLAFSGVIVFVLFSMLGLAYQAGQLSEHVSSMDAREETMAAEENAMQTQFQTYQQTTTQQLARIEQVLVDMQSTQEVQNSSGKKDFK